MLKPFINVIRACVISFAICAISSIVLEFARFPHSSLLQQFLIGAACSFIVVEISTYAQYKVEFNKAFSYYISATSRLIFTLALCQYGFDSKRQIEYSYNELNNRFEDFQKSKSEILYLSKKAILKFKGKNYILSNMYIGFLRGQILNFPEKAVDSVINKDDLIRAINIYLEYWPDCFEKENIKTEKEWLEKDMPDDSRIV